MASDKSVKKVAAKSSPRGQEKQKYLVSGKRVSLRLWKMNRPIPRNRPNVATRRSDM